MGMALKAVLLDAAEQRFHLAFVVNVFGKDVFVGGFARRAVNEEEVAVVVGRVQLAEEVPPLVHLAAGARTALRAVRASNRSPAVRRD